MTTYTFKFKQTDDPQVEDDEYVLLADNKDTGVSVQCCSYAGGYGVNSSQYEGGRMVSMTDHGVFRSLAAAKKKAIAIHQAA